MRSYLVIYIDNEGYEIEEIVKGDSMGDAVLKIAFKKECKKVLDSFKL